MKIESYVKYSDRNRGVSSIKLTVGKTEFYYRHNIVVGVGFIDCADEGLSEITYHRNFYGAYGFKARDALAKLSNSTLLTNAQWLEFEKSNYKREVADKLVEDTVPF